jgi:hypothetical protein
MSIAVIGEAFFRWMIKWLTWDTLSSSEHEWSGQRNEGDELHDGRSDLILPETADVTNVGKRKEVSNRHEYD